MENKKGMMKKRKRNYRLCSKCGKSTPYLRAGTLCKKCRNKTFNLTKKEIKEDKFQIMIEAISDYLKIKHWITFVMGDVKIQKQPDDLKYNYEFVTRFTGKKLKEALKKKLKVETKK